MSEIVLREEAGLVFREARPTGPESGPPVMLVHGFPESSLMWAPVIDALCAAGRRCVAPDLYCLGDSDDPGPATFERNLAAFGRLHKALELGPVAVAVHDWGGFIGLAWAAEHPSLVAALVISDTGFFPDGKWHGMASALRSEQGEKLIAAIDRDGFAGVLRSDGAAFDEATIDAYWRPFAECRGREATLEFYRSMDFEKLDPFQVGFAALGVPTLLLWGAEDEFAPLAGAKRFKRAIAGAKLVVLEDCGHFVFDQEPQRCAAEVAAFLTR